MTSVANDTSPQSLPRFGSAKFALPPRPRDLLRRPRLLDFLHERIHYKLNLVCAAAGYGKSSLLIDFAHETDYLVAWCRLDESDTDWIVLVSDVLKAFRFPFPEFQSILPQLSGQLEPEDLAKVLIREIAAGIDQYFILALDDFHALQAAPQAIRFFDALLADLPEQAHLLIAGRMLPPLKMTSLVARQQAAGLSEEHLRFTAEEIQSLIQLRNEVVVPTSEAEKIAANTEGWITGILLTTHLMWQGPIANLMRARQPESPVYNYLAEEVLDKQPEPLKQFLMESAVLPEMEPPVCDAVLGRSDSAALLQQAEARRLFVSVVGNEFYTYQYHHLFRDFLISKLNDRDPARLQELRRHAAQWYAQNEMPEAAVTFYVLAGDLMQAGKIAEAHAAAMFSSGRYSTLRHWAEQLVSIQHDIPVVYLYLATAQTDLGDLGTAERDLSIAVTGFLQHNDQDRYVVAIAQQSRLAYRHGLLDQALILAEQARSLAKERDQVLPLALALRYSGVYELALDRLTQAEDSLQQAVRHYRSIAYQFNLAWTLHDLANVLLARGQVTRAIEVQHEALEIWRQRGAPGPIAAALVHMGIGLHRLGQYQSALTTYHEALGWAERSGDPRWQAATLARQGDLLADLGDVQSALDLFRQALLKAEQSRDRETLLFLYRARARVERWAHNFDGALKWIEAAKSAPPNSVFSKLEIASLNGILLVESGRIEEGRKILEDACLALEQADRLADLARALLFRAYAAYRNEERAEAMASLERALGIADGLGYQQMLISEALSVREMLVALSSEPHLGQRLMALLVSAENMRSSAAQQPLPTTSMRSSSATSLEVRALGPGQIEKNGGELTRAAWTSQKARELFLFLIDRAPIARDEVLNIFWPDMSLARAVSNLHVTLFRLRHAIGDEIVMAEDRMCRLATGIEMHYDVRQFEQVARAALALALHDPRRLELLNQAATLYTGDYLTDLYVDWALSRREELNAMHIRVLREYADELIGFARYAEARAVITDALAVEPFQDELHERLLICLAESGLRHEVVNHYRRYRELLRNELGLEPPSKIRALYSRLLE
jgi:ATP/maltotriose-dependent transcriptional regulator MalT